VIEGIAIFSITMYLIPSHRGEQKNGRLIGDTEVFFLRDECLYYHEKFLGLLIIMLVF
jgi:hypothetical protein